MVGIVIAFPGIVTGVLDKGTGINPNTIHFEAPAPEDSGPPVDFK